MSQYRNTAFTSRRQASWRRNQNTVAFRPSTKLGPVSHTVIVALMVTVLGLIYLTQITKTSTYGYGLSELDTQRKELLSQKSDLEVESARLQALETVKSSEVAKNLQQPASIEYARN